MNESNETNGNNAAMRGKSGVSKQLWDVVADISIDTLTTDDE